MRKVRESQSPERAVLQRRTNKQTIPKPNQKPKQSSKEEKILQIILVRCYFKIFCALRIIIPWGTEMLLPFEILMHKEIKVCHACRPHMYRLHRMSLSQFQTPEL